jgi:hypothetical protein
MHDEPSVERKGCQAVTPVLPADAERGSEFGDGLGVPLPGGVIDGAQERVIDK